MELRPGFRPAELASRYDVSDFKEDARHAYSGERTREIIVEALTHWRTGRRHLLNAGAGIHAIEVPGWEETSVDLFVSPLQRHRRSVCASVEEMPFADAEFDSVVCVGEVLGYCDPARAIREFARVLRPGGKLVCDYGSSGSPRQWGDMRFRRAAALFDDTYNGSPERIWIYAPSYIESLLKSCGFEIERRVGWHFWSSVLGRCGIKRALEVERSLRWLPLPSRWCDLVTTVSVRR